jgi:hypothetical protein
MFHWICPECGREIPPAVKVCPACDPKAEQIPLTETRVKEPETPEKMPETPAAEAVSPAVAPPVAAPVAPEPVAAPAAAEVLSAAPEPPAPLDVILALAEQIRAAQVAALAPAPAAPVAQAEATPDPAPVAQAEPVIQPAPVPTPEPIAEPIAARPIETTAQELAGLAAVVGLVDSPTLDRIPVPAAIPVAAEPKQEQPEQIVQPVALAAAPATEVEAAAVPAPAPVAAAVALAPVETQIPTLPPQIREPEPAALAEPMPVPNARPTPVAPQTAPGSPGDALVQNMPPPPVPQTPSDRPPSGSWLRLAPLQNYTAAASAAMQPALPQRKVLAQDSGPRMTLPGPALPPQLNVRENLRVLTTAASPRKKRGIPAWAIGMVITAGVVVGAAVALLYLLPASSHTAAESKTPAPPVETAVVAEASHPLAQSIEVTGIRFVVDLNKKSEIQYLVVNHSSSELSDMTVFVTVRAANAKPGSPPLCRFSFRSTGLAPFESKEMTSPIEKLARPITLPDWHDLRAEVQIAQ